MSGRRTFVTGATGVLGASLVKRLLERGDHVVLLVRDEVRGSALVTDGLLPQCSIVRGDLLQEGLLDRAIGEHEVDSVFHLAAQTIVGIARRSPVTTFEANIRGTWLLMEACRTHEVGRVVVAASDKAYGPSDVLPYTEDLPLQPTAPYDVSKAATDLIARSYAHTYGVPTATTRFANIYGPGDLNPSRLIPEVVIAALEGRPAIIRSDGSPERDLLFSDDAADAYLAIADLLDDPSTGASGEAFNAGTGRSTSVREMVDTIIRQVGGDARAEYRGAGVPEGEIDRQAVDPGKLHRLSGWEPKVDLETGIARTIAWYREHRHLVA
ncbi:MAG: NAD-dependent epimerase/dehydratase family protein [Solirubrobacteraceae bacterium]|nr:NAD-dependent epimerase/dehydratase family protein [Solirubrobacteraceae bacterium]